MSNSGRLSLKRVLKSRGRSSESECFSHMCEAGVRFLGLEYKQANKKANRLHFHLESITANHREIGNISDI